MRNLDREEREYEAKLALRTPLMRDASGIAKGNPFRVSANYSGLRRR